MLTKGKEMVLGEVYLAFTGYNLKRTLSVMGFDDLMSKIKAHFVCFHRKYQQFINEITTLYLISVIPEAKVKPQTNLFLIS